MTGLRPFGGWVFTRVIDLIIAGAAVSGGCFPSALGLSVACVYTRYHHALDVLAGLTVAAVAAAAGCLLTRRVPSERTAAVRRPHTPSRRPRR